jgi:lysylphosphatidylglycerol synthetase-like protein (DUF2156 family)
MIDTHLAPVELGIPIPLGSRVLVKSSMLLEPEPTETSTTVVDQLVGELFRWQGTGTVIVAGGLFASSGAAARADEVLEAHGALKTGILEFLGKPGRQLIVLPSSRERSGFTEAATRLLEELGVRIADTVLLDCATANGQRRVLVSPAFENASDSTEELDGPGNRPWLEGIDSVESPEATRRFISSRILYRRLRNYFWVPPLVALVVALVSHMAFVERRLERLGNPRTHRVITRLVDAPWHLRFLWVTITVLVAELIMVLLAALIARHLFRATLAANPSAPREPEGIAQGSEQSALDLARSFLAGGGSGLILGGSRAAGLSYLDTGFLALPGRSARIVREHHGRLGLPPVFLEHRQESQITMETGAELHARLELFDQLVTPSRRLEHLVAGECTTAIPPRAQGLRLVASWPTGGTWPPPPDFGATQHKARRIRRLAAVSLFITGLLDLLIAVIPPLRGRLHAVLSYLPLGVSQTAAAIVAIIGIALIMLSRGILRGQRRAWAVAVVLLAASTALHVAHAANLGAVAVTAAVLVLLVLERRWFQGTTDRGSLRSALPSLVLIVIVAVLAAFGGTELSHLHRGSLPSWPIVLGAVSERLVGLSSIALPDRVDDFVFPTMLTVGIAVCVAVAYLVTRPVVDRRLSSQANSRERRLAQARARDIVTRHGTGTLDYFALRDDKQYFFFGDSLVAYAVFGGICLVSPDPIGPERDRAQVWGAFRAFCDAHGWGPGVIGASAAWLPIYDESGMGWIYIGDEAVVDVPSFSLDGKKMKGLRQACTRMARHGYSVEFLDPASIDPARVPALIELIGMNRRGEEERGFSMMLGRLFDPKDTGLLMTIVSGPDGCPAAMCQFVPSPAIRGFSLDLMRRDPGEHPNGLLDYALCSTIAELKARGATGLSLNFSAFRSTLDLSKGDGLTTRVERWGLQRLSSILPIESLWRFNEKYQPNWLPRHVVYSSPEFFVPTVAAALRAESLTELPVLGRFLSQDPSNRPGTVVPPELLEGRPPLEEMVPD